MKLEQIRKLKTLDKAYNELLPIVQSFKMPGYLKNAEDESTELIFESISLAKNAHKSLRGTLNDAIDKAIRVSDYLGITIS
jgi:hypothetical protein